MRLIVIVAILLFSQTVCAQEMDFSFDAEELEQDSSDMKFSEETTESGDMSFGFDEIKKEESQAETAKEANIRLIRVLQRRPFLRKKRYEISARMGTLVNDSLVNSVSAGGRFAYHLSEVMAISLGGAAALSTESELFEKVIDDYAVFPEVSKLLWRASADFEYAFLYGKFALFDRWIIGWDMASNLGVGAVQTDLAIHPSLTMGLSQRFFMNRWFTVNVGINNYLYLEDYSTGGEIVNHLVFMGGVSLFFPTTFEYRTLR